MTYQEDIDNYCNRYLTVARVGPVPTISKQEAIDKGMFGPVYHGTSGDINEILKSGFNVKYSIPTGLSNHGFSLRSANTANGYPFEPYERGGRLPPPIHHLGFGIYFSTVKK